ncbi:MAG: M24 family metallopeptidase, partial [Dehalococcoidia bacterium]
MYFPQEEYEQRWQRVYDEMKTRGYNTAVIWGRTAGTYERCADMVYLSNYYSTMSGHQPDGPVSQAKAFSALIFHLGETPELHMDMPSYDMELLATDRVEGHADPIKGVSDAMKRLGIEGRVAMTGFDFLPVKYARQLEQDTPGIEWAAEDDLVQSVRRIKSQRELDCYRHGGQIVSRALHRLIEGLVQGKAEAEAAAGAAEEVTRGGGRFHMIPVSHGDSIQYFCRTPLAGFSEDAPEPGDLVRGWVYGPIYQGYWLDPGRTAIAGKKATPEQKVLVEGCAGIVEGVMKAIKPGVRVDDVVRIGERLTEEAGGEKDQAAEMFPVFGHGVGLFWEPPALHIGQESNEVFKEGMVLGVEAFLATPSWVALRER